MPDIIMCQSAFNRRQPDEAYQREYDAAKQLTNVHLFDIMSLDALTLPKPNGKKLIYHGWMMNPEYYTKFYNKCSDFGYKLINTPEQYIACHHFNGWYDCLVGMTPKSLIIPRHDSTRDMLDHVMSWMESNQCGVVIKDYVKSIKHQWHTACYLPKGANPLQVAKVLANFVAIKEADNDFQGNLVVRNFVPLKQIGELAKNGMPLHKEFRTFVFEGRLLPTFQYWDKGDYGGDIPPISFIQKVASKVLEKTNSNLFTIDVAQLEDGSWTTIEIGDGQVSAIPEHEDRLKFWTNLLADQSTKES